MDRERILVTGSSGHLGEGLMRTLRAAGRDAVGVDVVDGPWTDIVGSIVDRSIVRRCMAHVTAVVHAATLHKPHVRTHSRQDFIDTNVTGTSNLLEEAASAGVERFVFTSTTSAFGQALSPPPDAPAVWVTEEVLPIAKNIYGATKTAAEDLCHLTHLERGLPCIVLRTSRFFPEQDDRPHVRESFADANVKANELLYRRVDLEDVVSAHLLALERAGDIGFARYIISATTPFTRRDARALRTDAPSIVRRLFPEYPQAYDRRGWRMFESIERVYDNRRAREELGWRPRFDFGTALEHLRRGSQPCSELARSVGIKGYGAPPR